MFLGVNIDHIATLRQARYALQPDSPNAEPSILDAALDAMQGGADSITMHVRADRRHMQMEDVFLVKEHCSLPINLEMGNTQEMLNFALELKPEFICLVPETREEVTTEGGLDVVDLFNSLEKSVQVLQCAGCKVSLFIDPETDQVEASARIGAEMIELHTGCFSNAFGEQRAKEVQRLVAASQRGEELKIQVNAGHGINYENIADLYEVPHLKELNIGHSLIARSTRVGLIQAVSEMRELIGSGWSQK